MLMQQEWVAVFYKLLCTSETNYTTELKFRSMCSKFLQILWLQDHTDKKNSTGLQSENFIFTFLSE
jgi:hypothetical protein